MFCVCLVYHVLLFLHEKILMLFILRVSTTQRLLLDDTFFCSCCIIVLRFACA